MQIIDPEHLHGQLMNVLHGSLAHPQVTAQRKSSYAKILSMLAQDQATAHASQGRQPNASPGGMGGVQAPQETGYPDQQMVGIPYLNLPQHNAGYGGMGGNQQPEGYDAQAIMAALRAP